MWLAGFPGLFRVEVANASVTRVSTVPVYNVLARNGQVWAVPNLPQDPASETALNTVISIDPATGATVAKLERLGPRGGPELAWAAGSLWALFPDDGAGPGSDDDGSVILELDPITLAVGSETPLPPTSSLAAFGFRFTASDDHLWLWSAAWDAEADAIGELSGIRFDPSDHTFRALNPGRWIASGDTVYRITDTLERIDPETLEVLNSVALEEPIDPMQHQVLIGSAGLYVSRPEGVELIDPGPGRSIIPTLVSLPGYLNFDSWGEIDGEMWRWDPPTGRVTPVR